MPVGVTGVTATRPGRFDPPDQRSGWHECYRLGPHRRHRILGGATTSS